MENLLIKKLIKNTAICFSSGLLLAACGGGNSQGPVANDTKLMADGEACNAAWVSTTAYVAGNKVSYSGRNYTAAFWTQNNNPSTSSGAAGSGQPWTTGFLCGGTTTTTKATTTTTKAGTTTTAATTTTTKATTTTTKGTSSCPAYVAGTTYTSGQTVTNAGGYYVCDVAGWCSSGAAAYEPGVGWAWTSAWHAGSASTCGGTGTTTTSAGTTTTKATTTTTSSSCNAVTWSAGVNYALGTIVKYTANGNYYKEVNAGTNGSDGTDPTISTWYWSQTTCSGGTTTTVGGTTTTTGSSSGFPVTEAQFNQIFPSRNSFYSYAGLVSAAASISGFTTTGSDTIRKQEAAAFLANVDHETGGLVYIEEIDKSGNYCDTSQSYGCPAGANQYYGRGPIQISWNFNYKAAGDYLGINLLNTPSLVATQSDTSWKTGIWYWMTQNGPGTMTSHNAMINSAGFGQTIRSINGSVECDGKNPAQVQSRVDKYNAIVNILGVPAGSNLSC